MPRKMEEETRRALLDNLPGGAGVYAYEKGRLSVVYLNKSYWELVGRKPSEYAALSPMAAVHPEDQAMVSRELVSAVELGRDMACDFRLRHETAGYRPFHLAGRVTPAQKGRYVIYVTFTPISEEAMSIQEMLPVAIQSMLDSSPEVSFIKGRDLRYISCSRRFALLSGRSSGKELIGKFSSDLFPPELAARNDAADRDILQGGKPRVDYDIPFPTADGIRHLLFSKYPLLDAQGNVLGVYGTGRDVTDTRNMQSRLEMLTNNIPGGIAVYAGAPDELDKIVLTYFSDGLSRLFGYTREEYERLSAVKPLGLVLPADVSGISQRIRDLTERGVPLDYAYRARAKDGELKWINVKAVMGEPDGDRLTVYAVFFDVTAQKEASERLRVSEEINRLAIQQSGNIVCRYDVAAKRLSISSNVAPAFQVAEVEEDIPEKAIRDGRISPDTEEVYKAFYESIRRGEPSGEALFQRRSTLGWRWVREHFTTIFSDSGEPATAVISFADVTESIERDAAYKRWKQSLLSRPPESYTLFRCSIGKETTLATRDGALLDAAFEQGSFSFDSRTETYARQYVVPEEREMYLSFLKMESLTAGYEKGERVKALEYREALPQGGFRWMRLTVDLVEASRATGIEAYLLFENIDEAKRMELALLERAERDPLTGLLNRAAFAQRVQALIREPTLEAVHALLMLDVDNFKQVNDVLGHGMGDQTLIDVAEMLNDVTRRNDLVGRLGGDEFVVFLYDVAGEEVAEKKARQICRRMRRTLGAEVRISASVGVALYPRDGDGFEALYGKADEALYRVKAGGKNGYGFYREAGDGTE